MTPSELVDQQIRGLPGWRGKTLAGLRKLIHEADPDIAEEWKWGTGVWSHDGMVCSMGAFKDHLKINFFQGAALVDRKGLFNAGLDAKATRAIDLREGDKVDAAGVKALIRAAVAHNVARKKKK